MKKHINYKIENKDSYENCYLNNEIDMKESDIMKTRSSEIKNANKERFQNGTSKLAKRICYGYSQNDKAGFNTYWQMMRDYDDICQDAFLRSFEILHKYHGKCRFASWVTKISYYIIGNRLNKLRRNKEERIDFSVKVFDRINFLLTLTLYNLLKI